MLYFFCTFRTFLRGEMLEWLKRHAWKACIRQKCIAGSNPAFSAVTELFRGLLLTIKIEKELLI